ncbi:hypothetical protein GCM10010174_79970 [Kutzneria viridogrisea]|uniref:DUF2157 domain-containing protein n=1 Tax=Kutzneria viridogrisea TaxID=47990 RepID=A0ABR6BBS8_9PSEU|nr:hypothetical protein [Kutzneria viridogrisea]
MVKLAAEQQAALKALVTEGTISNGQAEAVLGALETDRGPARARLAEVLGYVGAALLLAGASLVISLSWSGFTHAGRVGLLAGVTVVLAVAALASGVLRGRVNPVRARAGSVLLALAAVTGGFTGMIAAENHQPALVGGGVALVLAVLGYVLAPAIPSLLVAAVASFTAALGLVDLWGYNLPRAGLILVLVGIAWSALALGHTIEHRSVGLGVGAAITLIGTQFPMGELRDVWIVYGGTLLLAMICFVLYFVDRTPVLLGAGVVSVTVAVPEAVWDWTGGTVNGALLVLLAGLVLLAVGGLGMRLHIGRHA